MRARVMAIIGLLATIAMAATDHGVVELVGDRLTLEVREMPASALLEELARTLGAQVRGRPDRSDPITASFEGLPIPDALGRLFGENFTLVYDRSGGLRAIQFLGAPPVRPTVARTPDTSGVARPSPAAAPLAPEARDPQWDERAARLKTMGTTFAQHPSIPVSGRLASALGGKSTASLQQVFTLATGNPDLTVRTEATRLLANTIDADPTLQGSVLATFSDVPNESLALLARGVLGPRAEEFLGHVVQVTQQADLRQKASGVRHFLMTADDAP